MALVKITGLPGSTGIDPNVDALAIVHGGVTQKITPQALFNTVLTSPGPIGLGIASSIRCTTLTTTSSVTAASLLVTGSATIPTLTITGSASIPFTPVGTISATTVSSALIELGNEKASTTDLLSGLSLKTNIADLAAIGGATLVGFKQNGASTLRTLDAKSKERVSILDFGADPTGVTDSTTKIQEAFDYVGGLGGGRVYLPAGTYKINQSILIWSNTTATGDGKKSLIIANQTAFVGRNTLNFDAVGAEFTTALFRNKNWFDDTMPDKNILIEKISFDYGTIVPSNGGTHAVCMRFATNIHVDKCNFYEGNDATAMLHCVNTTISYCNAYEFNNCAWDHWESPVNAKVIGCYAETTGGGGMANFNPEKTASDITGLVADGFLFEGNTLVSTEVGGTPCQFEALKAGNTARNIVVSNNIFKNVTLACRADTQYVTIKNNTFYGYTAANTSTVVTLNLITGSLSPSYITFTDNKIINPYTTSGSTAAIRIWADNYVITNNIITGGNYYNGIDTSTFLGKVSNNLVTAGTSGLAISGTKQNTQYTDATLLNAWVNFGSPYSNAGYLKDENGFVHLRGVVSTGTLNTKAFALPAQLCPPATITVPVVSNNLFGVVRIDTAANGNGVVPIVGSNVTVCLDGISFKYSS